MKIIKWFAKDSTFTNIQLILFGMINIALTLAFVYLTGLA